MTSDDTLTLEKLVAIFPPPPEPEWATMLRRAHAVEVRVTTYLPERDVEGNCNLYVLDPNVAAMIPTPEPLPTPLLCRPEHESFARDALRALGITPVEPTPRL